MATSGWVLGIDTSTSVCVGLAKDGIEVASVCAGDSRSHAEMLIPAVQELLDQAQISFAELNAVAVGMGPGPFTGLRVGIAAGRTIASLANVKLYQVCSLDVLAAEWANSQTPPQGDFVICSDARRKQLYWAQYSKTGQRISDPEISPANEIPQMPIAGPGCALYPEVLAEQTVSWPSQLNAAVLAGLADQMAEVGATPLYLRNPDAKVPGKPKTAIPVIKPRNRAAK